MPENRDLIQQNIATELAEITVANGFNQTVETVEREYKEYDKVAIEAMPWVGFWPADVQPQPTQFFGGEEEQYLDLVVMGHVALDGTPTQAEKTTAISNLLEDVVRKLKEDRRRGGYAVETEFVQAPQTDEGTPAHEGQQGETTTFRRIIRVWFYAN